MVGMVPRYWYRSFVNSVGKNVMEWTKYDVALQIHSSAIFIPPFTKPFTIHFTTLHIVYDSVVLGTYADTNEPTAESTC